MGPSALILCELGQVRKEATAAENSSAGVRLVGYPSKVLCFLSFELDVGIRLLVIDIKPPTLT